MKHNMKIKIRRLIIKIKNWIAGYRCQDCGEVSDISASLLVKRARCNKCLTKYFKHLK